MIGRQDGGGEAYRLERRYAPLSDDPGAIAGRLLTYGRAYQVGAYRESISTRAFGAVETLDVCANLQHDRNRPVGRTGAGLVLTDSGADVRAVLDPVGPFAAEARALVAAGLVRGLSLEMRVRRDEPLNGVRVVREAELVGLALVDRPAYDDAVIARRMANAGVPRRWL